MLVNLIPEFLSTLSAADRSAAYHEYLDRHRPILGAYWQNYVLDPESPHAEPIIENALRSEEHTSELQSPCNLVCRLLLEKKKKSTHAKRVHVRDTMTST